MNLIVFDIDDTLTKSEYQHQLAYVNAMKHFGINDINTDWKSYAHHTDSFILKENYEFNKKDTFSLTFIEEFEEQMASLILKLDPVSEIRGASQTVAFFEKHPNYCVAFATGSLLAPAYIKLDQAGINYNPQLVIGSNSNFEREAIVAKAIDTAKIKANISSFENIISVGDGIWDLKTAKNLNLSFIGIGVKNTEDFNREHIKYHINDWHDFDLQTAESLLF